MDVIHPTATLGAIVVSCPAAAMLFEDLGLDYCCGGDDTLERACRVSGLDPQGVRLKLDALRAEPARPDTPANLATASIAELCEHIVVRRHGPLRVDLQRIDALLATVVRVHGEAHPELLAVQDQFATTRRELETHMRLEEETLFPACCALARDDEATFDPLLLDALRDDHDGTGDALRELRRLSGGYDTEVSLCATHRLLLQSLSAVEADIHVHVHEENNVLFPKVRDRMITGSTSAQRVDP